MTTKKLRIVLISGCIRSGTTLLDNLLGQTPGFFSGGELVDFWQVAQLPERLCACGTLLRECRVWKGVLQALHREPRFSRWQGDGHQYQYLRLRHLWRLITPTGRERFLQLAAPYARATIDLYEAIAQENNVHTIVDSSKSVERTYLLSHTQDLDAYVIHLVRDARAVAFSCRRKKSDPSAPNSYMQTYSPAGSALRWMLSQQVSRLCNISDRYLLLRYEDFITAPDQELRRIFAMIGEPTERRPKVSDNTIRLERVHSINGNANRFKQGPVRLRLDDEWQSQMSARDRALVTTLTWPLLKHYGYDLSRKTSLNTAEMVH